MGVAVTTRDCYHDWRRYGFHDVRAWVTAGGMVIDGRNPYSESYILDFAPGWAWVSSVPVTVAGKLGMGTIGASVLVKLVITFGDVVLLLLVMRMCRLIGRSPLYPVGLLALNPVSILITGYQGQFDNVTLIPIAVWIILLLRWRRGGAGVDSTPKALLSGVMVGLSMVFKHSSGPILLFTVRSFRDWRRWTLSLLLAMLLLAVSFLPYLEGAGAAEIYGDVFGQQRRVVGPLVDAITAMLGTAQPGPLLLRLIWAAMILLSALLAARRRLGILQAAALYYVSTVLFVPSMARHYFVYPLLFGAVAYPRETTVYSAVTSLYLLTWIRSAGPLRIADWGMHPWPVLLVLLLWWLRVVLPKGALSLMDMRRSR